MQEDTTDELTALRARVDQLQREARELETFVFSAVHDLKSPLFTARGFLELLEQEIEPTSPPSARPQEERALQAPSLLEKVRPIARALAGMAELLDGLVETLRLGRGEVKLVELSLAEIVEQARLLCSGTLRQARAEVCVEGTLPHVQGDRGALVRIVQNLFENACKYRLPDRPLEIVVRAGSPTQLRITDTGQGIPAAEAYRIFEPLVQLDPDSPGCGLGLAMVRRAMLAHGGRVYLDTTWPSEGASFVLEFPAPH